MNEGAIAERSACCQSSAMSLTDLKSAVDRLPSDELAELSAYVRRQVDAAWDDQIDADFAPGGRLSAVLDEVRSDIRAGRLGDLP